MRGRLQGILWPETGDPQDAFERVHAFIDREFAPGKASNLHQIQTALPGDLIVRLAYGKFVVAKPFQGDRCNRELARMYAGTNG